MDILNFLEERDKKFNEDKIWSCCDFCTRKKYANLSRISELKHSIETTKAQLDKLNEDLFANSEQGKLIRDIHKSMLLN